MTRFPAATSDEHTLYAALELSKNSWLLAMGAVHCIGSGPGATCERSNCRVACGAITYRLIRKPLARSRPSRNGRRGS